MGKIPAKDKMITCDICGKEITDPRFEYSSYIKFNIKLDSYENTISGIIGSEKDGRPIEHNHACLNCIKKALIEIINKIDNIKDRI